MTIAPLLASQDHPRYVLSLLAPRGKRADLQALFGFNLELAQIRDRVSEPLIGQMRLRFWLDALEAILAGNPPAQPAGQALAVIAIRYDLPRDHLARMIEIRGAEIGGEPPGSLDGAKKEALHRSGYLHDLAARILIGNDHEETLKAAQLAGTAWGLVGMIRSVPFDAGEGICRLPVALTRQAGLDPERVMEPDMAEPRRVVLKALADAALDSLREVQNLKWRKAAAAAVLIGHAARHQIQMLDAIGYDLSHPKAMPLIAANRLGSGVMAGLMWRSWLGRL